QMMQAVRPGGRVILADDDHEVLRVWPEPPGFMALWQAYVRTYDRLGNDPFVGRRLVQLLHCAGVRPSRNTWLFFGGCSGQSVFPIVVENMCGVLRGAREAIAAQNLLDVGYFEEVLSHLVTGGRRP